MSAEKNLFNWTLPITSRERLVLQPVILDTSEHAPASLLAGYSESPPKPQHVFIFPCSPTLLWPVEIKIS